MKTHLLLTGIFIFSAAYFADSQRAPAAHNKKGKKISASTSDSSDWYFKPDLNKDEKLSNIFSRTIAYRGEGFADVVQRISGTATYTVIENNPLDPVFESTGLYDGRPESTAKYAVKTNGQSTYDGKSYQDDSASGIFYNSFIWGIPPATLHEGDEWTFNISQPWELGGQGQQTVRVMQIDKLHHSITLLRRGSSEGFYDNDAKQIPLTLKNGKKVYAALTPGISTWRGYTTFKNGVVIRDELLVTRPITLKSDSLNFKGQQREYILLNAMPSE
ncbi:hypothetical protein HDF24_01110 [Mucilaginibacter sp. X4EP1]|uniref:hypothetical protein n=1 Tax=Mucilaginibacter sp. X4EP1 TaxID=2723092 RepID=UPI0021695059|nr:hypothetical protein [Mucilaginibacter sp. X4EP1]MCS3811614.1 hypothetical protein [Mucilaginibacter sp. X4EP1]